MKNLLIRISTLACLAAPAQAAPFLYDFTGSIDVSASAASFDASINFEGDIHTLSYDSIGDIVTGGPGVTVTNNGPDVFNFAFQSITSGHSFLGFASVVDYEFSQSPGTVYEGSIAPATGSSSVGTDSTPLGIPINFTGGGLGPNFTINFSALATDLAPELDGGSAALPLLSAMVLLGLRRKRR